MWEIRPKDDFVDVVWTGENDPKCRFCGEPLVGWMLKKMRIMQTEPYSGYALDIECLCPECRCLEIFGIAISEDTFNRIKCMELPG